MTSINAVVDLSRDGEIAVLTVNNPPVNALSAAVRAGIKAGIEQASADPEVKAIVLACAGRTFIAGADITEFGKPPQEPGLALVVQTIEDAPKPVVAALHGTTLGGGFEVALGCHYRVAVASAKVGLPEVKLGILPGAGGTQRLPRLIGAEKALAMILSGDQMGAKAAEAAGVIDAIVPDGDLTVSAIAFSREIIAKGKPLTKISEREDKIAADRGKSDVFDAARKANARKFRGTPQLDAIIDAVRGAVELSFAEGMKNERARFAELVTSDASKAMRYVFFAERQVAKIPDVAADTPTLPVTKVGILGAGTMGGGIAMNFLNAGIPVTIVETNQAALDRGLSVIRKNYEATAQKGRLTLADVEKRMGLLSGTLEMQALADRDLVIEAVFENMDIKKEVFGKLDGIVKQGAILASNTSYLDVNEIASATKRPESVIGLHFFSPANVMRLLEVVRGDKTAKPVLATAMQLAKKIGKVGVQVGVCYGFVGNRMLAQRQKEANRLVLEGAMPWDVDRVIYDFGLPMGPFAMSDLAGLDIGWSRENSSSSTLREILCEMDRRGQKTGAGFYDYDEKRQAKPSPVTEKIVLDFSAKKDVARRQISDQEILERCIYPMINEGAKILEEGKANRASDIDIVWINGYGWPIYRGGPMYYGDHIGLKTVLDGLNRYGFEPSALLKRLAEEGKSFRDL